MKRLTYACLISCQMLILAGCAAPEFRGDAPAGSQQFLDSKTQLGIDIVDHSLILRLNPETGELVGQQTILIEHGTNHPGYLEFSDNPMAVSSFNINNHPATLEGVDGASRLSIPEGVGSLRVEIAYQGLPRRSYAVNQGAIYTSYFACEWMFCVQEDFGDKASIRLELILPEKLETIGPGRLIEVGSTADGEWRAVWQEERAYSAYLYAFAAGDFTVRETVADDVTLRYLGQGAGPDRLSKLFASTEDMLAFFQEKAGTPFPHEVYTQLYVSGSAAQEAVSHSIIGARFIDPILETQEEDWVIAHELAHQWWGNGVTAADLSHFWLNEGIATFMVAAWKEHRWGREAYDHEIELARRRYGRAIEADFDVPLRFAGAYPSLGVRRAVQYSKGALFLYALRAELGDEVFWAGLAAYTSRHIGGGCNKRRFSDRL